MEKIDEENNLLKKYLQVGKIINTHGVRGELKVLPLTDDPMRFKKLKKVYYEKNESYEILTISDVKYFKNNVILKFNEIDNLDMAESYKGSYILVDRKDAVKLPADSYFISDIIGCSVYEENENKLGIVVDVFETGSNDVYEIKNDNGKEILIPALKEVVKEVLVDKKKIIVSLPRGLIEDEI